MAQHYKDLVVWQRGMDLVAAVYELTDKFPRREIYSLCDQIRRAAVSVPSNIAEGQAHFNRREFLHFLRHARGSLAELETQILIAERQKYISTEDAGSMAIKIAELGKILNGLIHSINDQVEPARR